MRRAGDGQIDPLEKLAMRSAAYFVHLNTNTMQNFESQEDTRLKQAEKRGGEDWRRWGTYLPERQWGTVREDYSPDGNAWTGFSFEAAQYRAYRWGEDGLLGWTDRQCRLCYSTTLWNGQDDRLKERLFGLTNPEGNHGEDVKEQFYYLDATPTHTYAKALYKYPQPAFPYAQLREENKRRGYCDREYELLDTGVFHENRYFDVQVEYAKHTPEDTLIRLTISNRGPEAADLHVLPTLTLRNNWSWHNLAEENRTRPWMRQRSDREVYASHSVLGDYLYQWIEGDESAPEAVLFTENDSNLSLLDPNYTGEPVFSKDAFHRYVVHGETAALRTDGTGTKVAFHFKRSFAAEESVTLRLRLVRTEQNSPATPIDLQSFDQTFETRIREADEFYDLRLTSDLSSAERDIARQAYAGLLWCKQFYYFIAETWMSGDVTQIRPSGDRGKKQRHWKHLFCRDVLSMPDKWEYPWFAAWDTAFHMIPMAEIDPEFAKTQLLLFLREWYMHPNGQIPAYEFAFSDVNPPVHAWAVWHVYRMGVNEAGMGDLDFLERAFQKMLLNFTWWVNRNDSSGQNLFSGGFLGMDNIGVFDRSEKLPGEATMHQADGTAWMGLYCACMLQIALELAHQRSCTYEDIASKFFEHYVAIIDAFNTLDGSGLWDDEQGFYFDHLKLDGKPGIPLKIKSMVGLVPLFSVCILKRDTIKGLDGFRRRMEWFLKYKPDLARYVRKVETENEEINGSYWLGIVPEDRLARVFSQVLNEGQFLSPYGIRSLSKEHQQRPYELELEGRQFKVSYVPAEGDSGMFGGNSNWRGPVWFPVNTLLVNAFERYFLVYGEKYRLECPTGSGNQASLIEVAEHLSWRLIRLFLADESGRRPCHGEERRYVDDPHWKDLLLFNEYFSGDDGRGVGASHQTGWTAMIATLIRHMHMRRDVRNRAQ